MSRSIRTKAATLAVEAAIAMDDHVSTQEIFSLCIMFESWILNGGDETQRKMKILPEDSAVVIKLVKPKQKGV